LTVMFFSLDQPVTTNQISSEIFCHCHNFKRGEMAWPLLF
jgi:hypothetical protein